MQDARVRRNLPARGGGPAAHRHVVGVAGLPDVVEREDGVGPDVSDEVGQPARALVVGNVRAPTIGDVEPYVLGDAEHREAGLQLGGADGCEPRRRPARLVGHAEFAAGRGHAHDPLSVRDGRRHDAAGQVRLVVGVGPDADDRPEGRRVGDGRHYQVRASGMPLVPSAAVFTPRAWWMATSLFSKLTADPLM